MGWLVLEFAPYFCTGKHAIVATACRAPAHPQNANSGLLQDEQSFIFNDCDPADDREVSLVNAAGDRGRAWVEARRSGDFPSGTFLGVSS